jgi:hypothetical protein
LTASPPAPLPKHLKKFLSALTLNDGDFSWWNGQSPFHAAPHLLQRYDVADERDDVRLRFQVVDEGLGEERH